MMTTLPMIVEAVLIADCLLQGEAAERGMGGTDDLCALLPRDQLINLRLGRLQDSSSSRIPCDTEMKATGTAGSQGSTNCV